MKIGASDEAGKETASRFLSVTVTIDCVDVTRGLFR